MTKRYDKLADNLVNINNCFANRDEAIALMKERIQRIVQEEEEMLTIPINTEVKTTKTLVS